MYPGFDPDETAIIINPTLPPTSTDVLLHLQQASEALAPDLAALLQAFQTIPDLVALLSDSVCERLKHPSVTVLLEVFYNTIVMEDFLNDVSEETSLPENAYSVIVQLGEAVASVRIAADDDGPVLAQLITVQDGIEAARTAIAEFTALIAQEGLKNFYME